MTEPHDTIENDLQMLTQYEGEPTELWKRAVEQVEAEGADAAKADRHRHWRFLNKPIAPRHLLTGFATAAVLVLVVSVLMPSLGKARSAARRTTMAMGSMPATDEATGGDSYRMANPELTPNRVYGKNYVYGDGASTQSVFKRDDETTPAASLLRSQSSTQTRLRYLTGEMGENGGPGEPQPSATRSVIRNVTMELHTPDVAATFLKARQLVSEAGGEFIEDSSLTGEDDEARANLTLRVSPDRLSEVLNELRTLGVVASEQARSEDVTDQVVDLEARLRNEQRVETELLELLESRADADLSEILKLQNEIGRVRTNIERFIAQRDRIARLVSLAKVLVIIRPEVIDPVIEKPKEASMWDYFKGSIKDSWEGGVAFLSNTVAGLLGILVGGLVWWIALIAAGLMVRRYVSAMPEPAP